MNKGDVEELYITDITAHGMGVARSADGAAVFVRGALPGDTVKASCYKSKKRFAEAETVEVVKPSLDRTASFCEVEGCGGCQYSEFAYDRQTEVKRRQIIQDLRRIGGLEDPEVDETISMEEPYYYRNKVTFQVGWKDDVPTVGFYRAGSHDIVDCPICKIQAPPAAAAASSLRTFMMQEHITCFDKKTKKGLLKDMIVRSCFATGEVMVVFELNGSNIPGADRLIDMMDAQIRRLENKYVTWSLESVYIVTEKGLPVLIAGKKTVDEQLDGVKFEISPLSFYQVNPVQTVRLYDKVFEYAQLSPGDSVLDLYCGVGSIGLFLEDRMDDTICVLGIESNKSAVLDANRNAVINGVINARYLCGAAEDVLPEIVGASNEGATGDFVDPEEGTNEWFAKQAAESAEVVVLDPPRAGCDEKLLQAVVTVSPERIVYVSCDPATLARDVKFLTANGYEFVKATPVDMFPHTGHVETVVCLDKKKSKDYVELGVDADDYYRIKDSE